MDYKNAQEEGWKVQLTLAVSYDASVAIALST
jgi:hypothetical protein